VNARKVANYYIGPSIGSVLECALLVFRQSAKEAHLYREWRYSSYGRGLGAHSGSTPGAVNFLPDSFLFSFQNLGNLDLRPSTQIASAFQWLT
jgi:hypothetical protein